MGGHPASALTLDYLQSWREGNKSHTKLTTYWKAFAEVNFLLAGCLGIKGVAGHGAGVDGQTTVRAVKQQ